VTFPSTKLLERSAELGVFSLTADKIPQIFGVRKHKRLRGKMHSALEKLDHGHRVYGKTWCRLYEEFSTFPRLEICVHRLQDLDLNKGLENLDALRKKLVVVTDRLAGCEAELLNVHVDFPLFPRPAVPVPSGKSKIPGIKIQDPRTPAAALRACYRASIRGLKQHNACAFLKIHPLLNTPLFLVGKLSKSLPGSPSPTCGNRGRTRGFFLQVLLFR
jgi:hypothetical protein